MRSPNGYGAVKKLGGKRRRPFAVYITTGWEMVDGKAKQIQKPIGYYATRQEAMIALADYNKSPFDISSRSTTFEDIYNILLEEKFNKMKPSARTAYLTAFNRCESIKNIRMTELKKAHMQKIVDDNSHMSRPTLTNLLKLFNAVYKFALENDICEKNYAEIEENVKMFRDVGINLIFVETFYHGCSAFKSDNPLVPYHPSLSSQYTNSKKGIVYDDYLSAFVACCVEYGIEVHAWVENFYVGIDSSAGVVSAKPEWIMYNDDGSIYQRKEGGAYIFIDPANPDVQDFLINLYKEILVKNPKISGLNLDYIRYPVSNRSQDTGYTVSAMKGFYELVGKQFTADQLADRTKMANKFKQLFDASYLKGGQTEANANYQLWVKYRTDLITDFVGRITDEVKSDSDLLLSTAVFASLSESLDSKKADWQSWFNDGWIDIATPMAYYTSSGVVYTRVQEMIKSGGNNCLYYTGIASSYSGLPAWQNKEFIQSSYDAGASGYVIFSSVQIVGHSDVQQVLCIGVNSKKAVLPHAEITLILEAVFNDILDKADRIYIPAGGMSLAGREELAQIFAEIEAMPYESFSQISNISLRVSKLRNNLVSSVNDHSLNRITDDLDYLIGILDARANMLGEATEDSDLPDDGVEIPDGGEEGPEIPDDDQQTPEKPGNDDNNVDNGNPDTQVKRGFFARLWQAIANFFKMIFGIRK